MDYGDREGGISDPSGNQWYIATRKVGEHFAPEGLRSVTPGLSVKGAAGFLALLQKALGASVLFKEDGPDGTVGHAKVLIGNSIVECSEAHGKWGPRPVTLHVYVPDVDAMYKDAVAAGAKSLSEPKDQFYGGRNGGVVDAWGNHWYIATPVEDLSGEQMMSRGASQGESIDGEPVVPGGVQRKRIPRRMSSRTIETREGMHMKRAMVCGWAILLMSCSAAAQDVSQADKDRALAYLESTKKGVVEATKGLSDAQWDFKAAPDRWSIAEVMEHLAAAEDMIRGLIVEKVMVSPEITPRDPAELKKIDDGVIAQLPDRSHKIQAPEQLKPTNRFGSPADAQKHFLESRATTEQYLKTTPDLRGHAVDSPMGVKLDGYEWVLLIAGHSERHTKQMLEVKADPNFPKQ